MLQRIFTGSYQDCKVGNLISISGDRGKVLILMVKLFLLLLLNESFGTFGIKI